MPNINEIAEIHQRAKDVVLAAEGKRTTLMPASSKRIEMVILPSGVIVTRDRDALLIHSKHFTGPDGLTSTNVSLRSKRVGPPNPNLEEMFSAVEAITDANLGISYYGQHAEQVVQDEIQHLLLKVRMGDIRVFQFSFLLGEDEIKKSWFTEGSGDYLRPDLLSVGMDSNSALASGRDVPVTPGNIKLAKAAIDTLHRQVVALG